MNEPIPIEYLQRAAERIKQQFHLRFRPGEQFRFPAPCPAPLIDKQPDPEETLPILTFTVELARDGLRLRFRDILF